MKLRAVIVDDEIAGRQAVRDHCAAHPDFTVVDECASSVEALEAISHLQPDVAFLDVQMKPYTGIELAARLPPERMPVIVFVTAYDRYALKAFEVNAVDYLLKPFGAERFAATLERVRSRIGTSLTPRLRDDLRTTMRAVMRDLQIAQGGAADDERLIVETGGRVCFLEPGDVEYVESDGNYVTIHARGQAHTVRCTLNELEERLGPPRFLRIHRSLVVNVHRIRAMEKWFHGEYVLEMESGRSLTSGRTYRHRLQGLVLRSRGGREQN